MKIEQTYEGLFIDGRRVTEEEFQQMCKKAGWSMMTDEEQHEMDELRLELARTKIALEAFQGVGFAARSQEILAGLPRRCIHCNGMGDSHLDWCPVVIAMKEQIMVEDTQESKPENPEAVNHHLTDSELKRYCDNARAYGWEAGLRYGREHDTALRRVYESSAQNPFVDPDWDRELRYPSHLVTAKDNQL